MRLLNCWSPATVLLDYSLQHLLVQALGIVLLIDLLAVIPAFTAKTPGDSTEIRMGKTLAIELISVGWVIVQQWLPSHCEPLEMAKQIKRFAWLYPKVFRFHPLRLNTKLYQILYPCCSWSYMQPVSTRIAF